MYSPSFDFNAFYGGGHTTEVTNPIVEKGSAVGDIVEMGGGKPTGGRQSMSAPLPVLLGLLGLAIAFAYVF